MYQSITQTWPSGPTSARDRGGPFVVAGDQVPAVIVGDVASLALERERGDQVTGRLGHEGGLVPVLPRIGPGRVQSVPGRRREPAVVIDLAHLFGHRIKPVRRGDALQPRAAPDRAPLRNSGWGSA